MAINRVVIVGAGPTGLLLALLLAKQNIQVDLVEASVTLDRQPRAAHYASPAAYELDRAGVLDDVQALGIKPNNMTWRRPDTTPIASLRLDKVPPQHERHSMVVLPLDQLGEILYAHLQRQPSARVWWSHRVVGVHHDDRGAWVECETPRGPRRLIADYVLGCDGAGSTVRQELFGLEYPGETFNAQLVATNVYYNFTKYAYTDINYIIDPKNFYMAARITSEGLYRVTYADIPGLTREEYIQRQPMRFQEILPGNPIPSEYYVTNISPYRMHQRCAPAFRVGRVVLVADAAHTCNPFGGLGLTGGIADAGCLFDALMGIHYRLADDRILDVYSDIRKQIWIDIIDPMSRVNFERLLARDANAVGDNDPFFQDCVKAETDDKLAAKLAMGLEVLRHDMTQYYDRRPNKLESKL